MTKAVESTTYLLGLPLDEGIKETVIALNCIGLETSGSCFGHADRPETNGPWVDIRNSELRELHKNSKFILEAAWDHYKQTDKYPMSREIKAYREKSRSVAEELGAKVQPLVTAFNTVSGHKIALRIYFDTVRITHIRGLEAKPPSDLAYAQQEMTDFGHYIHNQFLTGAHTAS